VPIRRCHRTLLPPRSFACCSSLLHKHGREAFLPLCLSSPFPPSLICAQTRAIFSNGVWFTSSPFPPFDIHVCDPPPKRPRAKINNGRPPCRRKPSVAIKGVDVHVDYRQVRSTRKMCVAYFWWVIIVGDRTYIPRRSSLIGRIECAYTVCILSIGLAHSDNGISYRCWCCTAPVPVSSSQRTCEPSEHQQPRVHVCMHAQLNHHTDTPQRSFSQPPSLFRPPGFQPPSASRRLAARFTRRTSVRKHRLDYP
jgi:hypothetical protein